jgi:hypothetical protein
LIALIKMRFSIRSAMISKLVFNLLPFVFLTKPKRLYWTVADHVGLRACDHASSQPWNFEEGSP